MRGSLTNIVIIAAVAGIGGTMYAQKKASPPQLPKWERCYEEKVKGPVATYAEEESGMPKGWHRQVVAALTSRRQSPQGLPADIMAMPEISGAFSLPNLRVAMAQERSLGKTRLFDAVRKFQQMDFDTMFSPGGKPLEAAREILFMWAGVVDLAPDGRGPFIDGRELAFMERIFNEKFYQVGRFPDPLPMAAAAMKDAFAMMRNHYFAELAAQGAGRKLLDFSRGYPGLNAAMFKTLSGRASNLTRPEDKLHFWQRVVGAIPYDVMHYLNRADQQFLDARIRESAPQLNLKTVLTSLKPNLFEGPNYYDRLGREVVFNIIYSDQMNTRVTCYLYKDQL